MSSERHDAGAGMAGQQRLSNPGETLRAARTERRMTQVEIAQNLKISVAAVEGIENGLYDRLPGDTFARGYIRSYARLVGLDPNRLALEFDRFRGIEVRERPVSGISRVAEPRRGGSGAMRWVGLLVLLVLVASVVWWYDNRAGEIVNPLNDDVLSDDALLDEVEVDALTLPPSIAEQADSLTDEQLGLGTSATVAEGAVPVQEAETSAATEPATTADEAVASTPVEASEQAEPAAESAQPAASPNAEPSASTAALSISFTSNCWVQIKAVNGPVLHSALMQAGQSINLDQAGALDLVIGDRSAVQSISYRGEQIILPQQSQSGVARLRLGQ